MARLRVLGIEVSSELLSSWAAWLAPDPQPFVVGAAVAGGGVGAGVGVGVMTPELRDTYRLWGVPKDSRVVWLTESEFVALPPTARATLVREQVVRRRGAVPTVRSWRDLLDASALRAQSDGHRFVWWPSLVATDPVRILSRVVSTDRLASRHREVGASAWRACARVPPGARSLAGSFADGSVENCFSTVMAAAGASTAGAYDSIQPFVDWLGAACRPVGTRRDDGRPGTVFVWRDRGGDPVHAAVTIGDGWMLEKPSQEWHSPRAVAAVRDVVRTSRLAGQRLERHTLR